MEVRIASQVLSLEEIFALIKCGMTWIILKEPPTDLMDFIGAPGLDTPEKSAQNLRELVKQGTSNIKAIRFDVSIIKSLEKEIIGNGYRIEVFPSEMESFASFYLVKF